VTGIAQFILRLKPTFRFSIYGAFAVLFLSGASWLVADWQKNNYSDEIWQQTAAYLLSVHGGAAMVALLLLGALIPVHVLRSWRGGNNLVTGSVMVMLNTLLVVTAFGLYYLGSETVRPWMSWTHIVVGFSVPVFLAAHILLGRRRLK
jgi:hypothetical protein